ncbi:MAG: hypothetical protein AABX55_00220 [Nanoarchaeota archaeon]
MPISRLTAYKIWIANLINSPYVNSPGEFESNYISFNGKEISRVNIIATVVDKFVSEDNSYVTIMIDDSSSQIRLKTWREDTSLLKNINLGDVILLIARVKNYQNEIYLLPEIVKNVNPNWEIIRKLELLKEYGKPEFEVGKVEEIITPSTQITETLKIEEISFSSTNLRNELLNLIEKYEEKLGISLEEIKTELHYSIGDMNNILQELIKEGQIYQIGEKYRLML